MLNILRSPLIPWCLIAFGIFSFYAGYKNGAEFSALRSRGKTIEAEVTKVEWKEKKSSHSDDSYTVYVRFTTEDGREAHGETHVPNGLGRSLRSTARPHMTIRYLPESPSTLREANEEDPSYVQKEIGRYMFLAGLFLLVLRFFFSRRRAG